MPTDNVKNIWPAAASHTFALFRAEKSGFQRKPRPFAIFQPGREVSGVPSVKTRTIIIIANMSRRGMAILQSFSMPPLIP